MKTSIKPVQHLATKTRSTARALQKTLKEQGHKATTPHFSKGIGWLVSSSKDVKRKQAKKVFNVVNNRVEGV